MFCTMQSDDAAVTLNAEHQNANSRKRKGNQLCGVSEMKHRFVIDWIDSQSRKDNALNKFLSSFGSRMLV